MELKKQLLKEDKKMIFKIFSYTQAVKVYNSFMGRGGQIRYFMCLYMLLTVIPKRSGMEFSSERWTELLQTLLLYTKISMTASV